MVIGKYASLDLGGLFFKLPNQPFRYITKLLDGHPLRVYIYKALIIWGHVCSMHIFRADQLIIFHKPDTKGCYCLPLPLIPASYIRVYVIINRQICSCIMQGDVTCDVMWCDVLCSGMRCDLTVSCHAMWYVTWCMWCDVIAPRVLRFVNKV